MIKSTTRRNFLIDTAAFAVASNLAAPALARGNERIRLGVIQPQTGVCATWGVPITRGAELWAEEVNESGGVQCGDGKRYLFEVSAYDNVCYVPGDELTAARKAILDDGCQFLLQTMTPASRQAIAELVTEQKVLAGSYGAGFVSEKYPYLLGSITGIPTSNMIHLATVLKQYPDIKRVAIMAANVSYGQAAAAHYAAACEVFKDQGVEIVFDKEYDNSAKSDMFGMLTPVLDTKPDIIVEEIFVPGEKPIMIETLEQLGYKGKYCSESWPLALINQRIPVSSLAGRIFTAFSVEASEPTYNKRAHAFYKRFVDRYSELDWTVEAANAYCSLATFEAGMALSKNATSEAVLKALYGAQTIDHPIFGPSKWGGEEVFGVNHQLLTELPVYGVGEDGSFILEGVTNAHMWWQEHREKALPVLRERGQVFI